MPITERTELESVEILDTGEYQIKEINYLMDGEEVVTATIHRRVVMSNELAGLPVWISDIAGSITNERAPTGAPRKRQDIVGKVLISAKTREIVYTPKTRIWKAGEIEKEVSGRKVRVEFGKTTGDARVDAMIGRAHTPEVLNYRAELAALNRGDAGAQGRINAAKKAMDDALAVEAADTA